jgi:tripartite-type tricarboxylate transporter receptor subunit TctC
LSEAGYKELEIIGWYCVVGPANLPRAIVERLESAIPRAVNSPEFSNLMKAEGTDPVSSTPDELRALMKAEVARWAQIVAVAGVKPGKN